MMMMMMMPFRAKKQQLNFLAMRLIVVLATITKVSSSCGRWPNDPTNRPNILLFYFDDLNDWPAFVGKGPPVVNLKPGLANTTSATPNMDRFAASKGSTNFINAYTPSPVCLPARTAVLTGYAPERTGIQTTAVDWWNVAGGGPNAPRNNNPNLFQFFKDQGYQTYGTGKVCVLTILYPIPSST